MGLSAISVNAQDTFVYAAKDSVNSSRLRVVSLTGSAFYAGGLYYLNNIWYKNHQSVPFHFYNDWKGWIQIDKAGHMYSAYYQSYYGMQAFKWAGLQGKKGSLVRWSGWYAYANAN